MSPHSPWLRAYLGLPIPLPEPWHVGGAAWAVHLPGYQYLADSPQYPQMSTIVVYEDGIPLARPHAQLQEIREHGGGRFVHWGEHLVLSSTDSSDPRSNGRRYTFSRAWWYHRRCYGPRRLPPRGSLSLNPATYLLPDASAAAIERDAAYALSVAERYLQHLPGGPSAINAATVLEVGPGCNLGSALLLSCLGATVLVTDRFPTPWDARYHPRLYQALRTLASVQQPQWNLQPLAKVIDEQAHEPVLRCLVSALESLAELADASVDIVVSNAMLEHSYDLPRAVRELARVTRPGGLGLHQVDHRDHRFPERPLEFLVLADHEFEQLFTTLHGECGNRWRPHELELLFGEQGFELLGVEPTRETEPGYLQDLLARLRKAEGSCYRHTAQEQLTTLSAFFTVRRR